MHQKTYITAIGTANPPFKVAQTDTAQFMAKILRLDAQENRKLKIIYQASAIDYRYTVLEDYQKTDGLTFFSLEDTVFPSTAQRMKIYQQEALPLAIKAIQNLEQMLPDFEQKIRQITHLITVSCTGMYAPGLDIELIETLKLNNQIERTCINFMGCYAAFNALKVADSICKSNTSAKVLIMDLELCTLHLQNSTIDDDLIANAIFSDGAAAVLLESTPNSSKSISLESFYCDLAPQGKKEMAWNIHDFGFEMRLSSYIPDLLKCTIRDLIANLLKKMRLSLSEIDFFAPHPGGKRILQAVEQALEIGREKTTFAHYVLKNYGNMSSVTVLFVLKEILLQAKSAHHHQNILSMAFGPGLTLESAILKLHCA